MAHDSKPAAASLAAELAEFKALLESRGLSPRSIRNYDYAARAIESIGKPVDEITARDLTELEKEMRATLSAQTVEHRKTLIGSLLQYTVIGPEAAQGQYPECVRRAWRGSRNHRSRKDGAGRLPDITRGRIMLKDVGEIVKVVGLPEYGESRWTLRNKALFAFLWDSGARLSEAITVKIADLRFEGDAGAVKLSGKTGTRRDIPLAWCVPYVKRWLVAHPHRNDGEAPIFCTSKGRQMSETAVRDRFDKAKRVLAERGYQLEDNVVLHSFRHGRAQYAKTREGLGDEQMRAFFGWARGSAMPSRYGGAAEVTDAVLSHWGIETGQAEKGQLPRLLCGECGTDNPPEAHFCLACGAALDDQGAKRREERETEMENLAKRVLAKNMEEMMMDLGFGVGKDSKGRLYLRGPPRGKKRVKTNTGKARTETEIVE